MVASFATKGVADIKRLLRLSLKGALCRLKLKYMRKRYTAICVVESDRDFVLYLTSERPRLWTKNDRIRPHHDWL